jgi:hypothetical protein
MASRPDGHDPRRPPTTIGSSHAGFALSPAQDPHGYVSRLDQEGQIVSLDAAIGG